jgi:protochlorophyllide reductase
VQKVSPQARDDEKGERMWELSAKLVGLADGAQMGAAAGAGRSA